MQAQLPRLFIWREVSSAYGNTSLDASHWVLMTKMVIPNSRNKGYTEQLALVESYQKGVLVECRAPKVLEALTCIFAQYVTSGIRLYNDAPWTFTRCQDRVGENQAIVGAFGVNRLIIESYGFDAEFIGIAALRRF
jgi:hypothetical protein